jgi:hypothetical protein
MVGPRHPESRWFFPSVGLAALLSVGLGAWCYRATTHSRSFASMSENARGELGKLKVIPRATAVEEGRWVADGFATGTLMAPVGPLPCREAVGRLPPSERAADLEAFKAIGSGDTEASINGLAAIADQNRSNLLVADMLATSLVRAERYAEADRVVSQALDSTNLDERIIAAARAPNTPLDLDDVQFSTVIHLHHALGIARLSEAGSEVPWKALKNVIGSVKELSRKRLLGTVRTSATASKLLIPAPGCAPDAASLSSYDLYNNLIIGYVRRPDYSDTERNRLREFERGPKTYPGAVHQLFVAQRDRAKKDGWKNEAQLWALSNAEQVLDWRRPDDARLDFNLVQLLDWWTSADHCGDVCTPELLAGLRSVEDELVEAALRRRNVTTEQQREFAIGMTRMVAQSHLDRTKLAADLDFLRGWLPPEKAQTLDDLVNAERARGALPQWVVDPHPDTEPAFEKLGRRAESWRAAACSDFASAAAIWAADRSAIEQRQVLVASRQLLGITAAPPEVQHLEMRLPLGARVAVIFGASRIWWGFIAAAMALLTWLATLWVLLQIREWRALRTSFYNVELDYQRGTGERRR